MTILHAPAGYQPRADLLKDRIILITGAGGGIGRTLALACAQHGATVVLLGRRQKQLEEVYDQIVAAGGPTPAIVPMNLTNISPDDVAGLANTLAAEFGRLDGLLNNASILGDRSPIESYRPHLWLEVMQTNVNAGFLLTQGLLPLLRKSADASVLFTSSGVGRQGRAYWGAYAVSKFATEGLVQVLADELDNTTAIRVNAINPGATRTKMRAAAYPSEDVSKVTPPEALVPAYLWLLGPDSKGVTGQSIDAQS